MAKKKNSITLFEAISQSKEAQEQLDMNVPGWMGGKPTEEKVRQSEQASPEPSVEPRVSTSGGKLTLSLDYVSSTLIAVGLLLLLAIAFAFGRATAGKQESPAGSIITPGATVAIGQDQPVRVAGMQYLVIQGMQGSDQQHYDEAAKIVAHLGEHGVAAEIRSFGDPMQYVVWALEGGVDSPKDTQAIEYIEMIEELGSRYMAKGGKYNFKQQQDGWWFKHQ